MSEMSSNLGRAHIQRSLRVKWCSVLVTAAVVFAWGCGRDGSQVDLAGTWRLDPAFAEGLAQSECYRTLLESLKDVELTFDEDGETDDILPNLLAVISDGLSSGRLPELERMSFTQQAIDEIARCC